MIEAEEKVSEEETQPHQQEIPKENGEKEQEKLEQRETEGKGKEKEKEKEKEKGRERDKRKAMTLRPTSRTKDFGEKEEVVVTTESRRSDNIFAVNDVIDRVMYLALEVEKAMAGLERKADSYGIQLNDLEVLVAVMNNVLVVLEEDGVEEEGGVEKEVAQRESVAQWLKTSVRNLHAKEEKQDEAEAEGEGEAGSSKKDRAALRKEKLKDRIQQRLTYARAHTTDFMERFENGEMEDEELMEGVERLDCVLSLLLQ